MEELIYKIVIEGADEAKKELPKIETQLKKLTAERNNLINKQVKGKKLSFEEKALLTSLTAKRDQLINKVKAGNELSSKERAHLLHLTHRRSELIKKQSQGVELTAKETQRLEQLSKKQIELRDVKTRLTQTLKQEAKLNSSVRGAYDKLSARLSELIKRYRDLAAAGKGETEQAKRLQKEIQELDAKIKQIDATTGRHQRNVGNYTSALGKLRTTTTNLLGAFGVTGGLFMFGNLIREGVHDLFEYEKSLTNVLTLLDESQKKEFGGYLKEGSIELQRKYGLAISDTNKAMFDAVSAGVEVSRVVEFLDRTAELSVGGVTDLSTSVNGVTSILNAYGLEVEETEKITSAFFSAQKFGKTTVAELSNEIGKAAPIAKQAGVSYQELLSTFAELTKQGLSTQNATTAIKSTMTALLKPSEEAKKKFDELGISYGASAVKSEGLMNILGQVSQAAEENADVLTELIPNVEALTGVGALGTDALEDYHDILQVVNGDYGEGSSLANAYLEQSKTLEQQWAGISATIRTSVLGVLQDLFYYVRDNSEALKTLAQILTAAAAAYLLNITRLKLLTLWQGRAVAITKIQNAITAINTRVTAANTVVTKAAGIAKAVLTGKIKLATAATKAFNFAVKSNPLGIFLTILTTVGGALLLFNKKAKAASTGMNSMAEMQKKLDNISKNMTDSLAKERAQIEPLVSVLQDNKEAAFNKLQAYKKLKEIAPDILKDLTFEEAQTDKLTTSVNEYIAAKENEIRVRLREAELTEIIKEEDILQSKIDRQKEVIENQKELRDLQQDMSDIERQRAQQAGMQMFDTEDFNKSIEELRKLERQMEAVIGNKEEITGEIKKKITTIEEGDGDTDGGLSKEEIKEIETRIEKRTKLHELFQIDYNKMKEQTLQKTMNVYEREVRQTQLKFKEILDEAEKAKKSELAIIEDKVKLGKISEQEAVNQRKEINARYSKQIKEIQKTEQDEYDRIRTEKEKETQEKILEIKKKYGIDITDELREAELKALDELYEKKELKEEEYQQAKKQIEEKYSKTLSEDEIDSRILESDEKPGLFANIIHTTEIADLRNRLNQVKELFDQALISKEQFAERSRELNAAIQEANQQMVDDGFQYGAAAIRDAENFQEATKQLGNAITEQIKMKVAAAVADVVAEALTKVPFPFNIALATAAGGATLALLNAIIPKFKKGGVKQAIAGGQSHSTGGTKYVGEDGNVMEVERGELLTVVNKRDTETLQRLSEANSVHGKPFKYAGGGIVNNRLIAQPVNTNEAILKAVNELGAKKVYVLENEISSMQKHVKVVNHEGDL